MLRLKPPISLKLLGVVFAFSFLTSACSPEKKKATGTPGIPVKLQTLKTATVIDSSNYVGTLEARQRVNLAPRINGRILEIFVKEGDTVKRGKPIVKLEPTQQQEQVNAAVGNLNVERAKLGQSKAEVDTAKAEVERAKAEVGTAKAEVGTAKAAVGTAKAEEARIAAEVERARANLATAQANVEDGEAELKLAKINYNRSQLLVREGVRPQQDLDDRTRDLETKQAQRQARIKARDAAKESFNATKESLKAAQESLNGAKESLKAAQESLKAAQESLNGAGKRVEQALANVDSQNAAVKRAQGQLGAIGQELDFNTIVAPIDGVVGDFNAKKVGDFLNIGQEVTTITDNKVFLLNINIPTEYRSQLRQGLPVEIINSDGTIGVRGQVTFISPSANQQEQSILTKITFPNDGNLKDREYVQVRVIWNQKSGLLVPTTAVTKLGGQSFVFVAEPDSSKDGRGTLVAKQKPVVVGNIQGQSYPVVSGVSPGDKIAVDRILDLKDGTPITEESVKSENIVEQ